VGVYRASCVLGDDRIPVALKSQIVFSMTRSAT
jgi:hypothetical protein